MEVVAVIFIVATGIYATLQFIELFGVAKSVAKLEDQLISEKDRVLFKTGYSFANRRKQLQWLTIGISLLCLLLISLTLWCIYEFQLPENQVYNFATGRDKASGYLVGGVFAFFSSLTALWYSRVVKAKRQALRQLEAEATEE